MKRLPSWRTKRATSRSLSPASTRIGAKKECAQARRLIKDFGVKGFKFHPSVQEFFPNDRLAYPLYEAIAEAKLPALFHTGQTGVGAGTPGGGGIRLKYSNPLYLDDVAADFPDMPIILAHPSFPWQEEALSVATHKPQVYIDLSGWSPKYFPPILVQYANTLLKEQHPVRLGLPRDRPGEMGRGVRQAADQARGAAADHETERGAPAAPRLMRAFAAAERVVAASGSPLVWGLPWLEAPLAMNIRPATGSK